MEQPEIFLSNIVNVYTQITYTNYNSIQYNKQKWLSFL